MATDPLVGGSALLSRLNEALSPPRALLRLTAMHGLDGRR